MRRRLRPAIVRVVALGACASALSQGCASSTGASVDAGPSVDACATGDRGCEMADATALRDAADVSVAEDAPRVCPSEAPADGAPCVHEGLRCEWLVVEPLCVPPLNTRGPSADCRDGRWRVGDNTCNPPPPKEDAGPDASG